MPIRRGRFWLALAGTALLALVVRLTYLTELAGSPLLSGLMGDGRQYDAWAQRIAGGDWIGVEIFYQAPLYPYALAAAYKLLGHDVEQVRVIQALLGSASCMLVGLAGRRFFSESVGLVAALLLAVYPPAFFFDGLIQKSSLDIFLVTSMLAVLAEFTARRDGKWLAALGLITAAFVLNRENAGILLPIVGAWLWAGFKDVSRGRRAAWIAAFGAAAMAVLLPVGFRNYQVGGQFLLTTAQLGPNFYIGNNAGASGTYEALVPDRGDALLEREDATRIASEAVGRPLSPREVSDYWLGRSFAYIRDEPLHWLGLIGRKALLTVNAAEMPDTESIEAYAGYSRLLRGLHWFNFGVILPFAVIGAWAHRGRWRSLAVLYAAAAGLALTLVLFYVLARYRHPLVPIILLFAAAGGGALWAGRPAAPVRQWLPVLALAGLTAATAHLPVLTVRDQTYVNLGSLLAQNGRPAEAIELLSRAVTRDPQHAEAHFRLGLACRDAGRTQAAIDALAAAVRLQPDHADAQSALGDLLRGEGRVLDALPHFQAAARLAPESAAAHVNLGLVLLEAGRLDDGIPELRRGVDLAPQDANARANLASALAAVRDFERAFEQFLEAARLRPDDGRIRLAFGQALCEAGLVDAGLGQYREALRLSPDSLDALTLTAQALARLDRVAEALTMLERALAVATATGRMDAAQGIRGAIQQLRTVLPRVQR